MDKKSIKYYVVDSFTDSAFKGNPAAVCLLEEEKNQEWLQTVASEFNLGATAFIIPISHSQNGTSNPQFCIRWFSSVTELILCGHGTLAAAHVLFSGPGLANSNVIEFVTRSGTVRGKRVWENNVAEAFNCEKSKGQQCFSIELDFPTVQLVEFGSADTSQISQALGGASVIDIKRTIPKEDLLVILPSSKDVKEVKPNYEILKQCPGRGIIISGIAPPNSGYDYYSRFFCPKFGIYEDPVCGSAHCALATYWSEKLAKCEFIGYAASQRGGVVEVRLDEQSQRVLLRGKAFTVMEGCLLT